MKHGETLKRIREERVSQALIDAFFQTAVGPLNEDVLKNQEVLVEQLSELKGQLGQLGELKEQLQALTSVVDGHIRAVEKLSNGVNNISIPETDLKPVINAISVISQQVREIEFSPDVSAPEVSYEKIVEAVKAALPVKKTWTFTVDRDSRGLIKKVEAN